LRIALANSHLRRHCQCILVYLFTCFHVDSSIQSTSCKVLYVTAIAKYIYSLKIHVILTNRGTYSLFIHVIALAIRSCGIAFAETLTPETVCRKRSLQECLHVPFLTKSNPRANQLFTHLPSHPNPSEDIRDDYRGSHSPCGNLTNVMSMNMS
jgi:hypothetical protein